MTVAELIDQLSGFDEDTEVMIAFQPSYPLAGSVENVTQVDAEETVWIAAGDGYDYAPRDAWY